MRFNPPIDATALRSDPLSLLRAAHAAAGDIVLVTENGPAFPRKRDCTAAVAVFGTAGTRQVLSDADLFGPGVSVGELLSLPSALGRLNAGLFSMTGEEHSAQQQLLRAALDSMCIDGVDQIVAEAWQRFAKNLRPVDDIPLLSEMQRLVLHSRFSSSATPISNWVGLLSPISSSDAPFSAAGTLPDLVQRRALIQTGARLDRPLRARMLAFRMDVEKARRCMMGRLHATANKRAGATEDQLIAQANTLFMSSSEPIAVSLTWILLILSLQPHLRHALRLEQVEASERVDRDRPPLQAVICACCRQTRSWSRSQRIWRFCLATCCRRTREILLSPFVAHRDGRDFQQTDVFDPPLARVEAIDLRIFPVRTGREILRRAPARAVSPRSDPLIDTRSL